MSAFQQGPFRDPSRWPDYARGSARCLAKGLGMNSVTPVAERRNASRNREIRQGTSRGAFPARPHSVREALKN